MANRKDYYFRQKVLEAELDAGYDEVELADWTLAIDNGLAQIADASGVSISDIVTLSDDFDAIRGGIHDGLQLSVPAAFPQPLTAVTVSEGFATDRQGRRIATGANLIVDITSEGDTPIGEGGSTIGGSIVTPPVGQTRIVTLMTLFDRKLLDERVDGDAQTVFFDQQESFIFRAKMGNASAGTPTPPPGDADGVILADVEVGESGGSPEIVAWDFSRRGDWIRTSVGTTGDPVTTGALQVGTFGTGGTDFIVRDPREGILRMLRVVGDNLGDLAAHTNQASPGSPHKAANIEFEAPGTTWLDATTLVARAAGSGLTDGTQGAIREIMEDMSRQGVAADGAGIIGSEERVPGIGTGHASFAIFTSPAGTVSSQLLDIVEQVESQIVERTIGNGGDAFGDFDTTDFAGDMGATLQAAINSVPDGRSIRIYIGGGLVGGTPYAATTQVTIGTRQVFLHGTGRTGTVIDANITNQVFIIDTVAQADSHLHMEDITFQSTTAKKPAVAINGRLSARNCSFDEGLDGGAGIGAFSAIRHRIESCTLKGDAVILTSSWFNTSFDDCVFELLGGNNADSIWDGPDSSLHFMKAVQFTRCRFQARTPASAAFFWYFQFADGDAEISFVDCAFADTTATTQAFMLQKAFAVLAPRNISAIRCQFECNNGVADLRAANQLTVEDCKITLGATNAHAFLVTTDEVTDLSIRDNVVTQTDFASGTKYFIRTLTPSLLKRAQIVRNKLIDVDIGVEFKRMEQSLIGDNNFISTTSARCKQHIKGGALWSFDGLTIRNNTFDGIRIDGTAQYSIDLQTGTFDSGSGASRLMITDNFFKDIGVATGGSNDNAIAIGITADSNNATQFSIRGNEIENVQSDNDTVGIYVVGVTNLQIQNNILHNIGQDTDTTGPTVDGILVIDSDHVVISNNLLDNIGGTGAPTSAFIAVSTSGAQRASVSITGNQCIDLSTTSGTGISVVGGFEQVVIANNNIDLQQLNATGINCFDGLGGGNQRQVSITGNQINGGAGSIVLNWTDSVAAADSQGRAVISANNCNNYDGTGIDISASGTPGLQRGFAITGNVLFSAAEDIDGIHLNNDVHHATISANQITHTAAGGVVGNAGIFVDDDALNINVSGNQLFIAAGNVAKSGILVGVDANNIWVTGNNVRMPSSAGTGINLNDTNNDQWAYNNECFVGASGNAVKNNGSTGNQPFLLPNLQVNNQLSTPASLTNITSNITRQIG